MQPETRTRLDVEARLDQLPRSVKNAAFALRFTHQDGAVAELLEADVVALVVEVERLTAAEKLALAALREEQAWDMGGVTENEYKARAEKAETAIRAYVSAWDANADCIDCADDDEFCDEHLEALHLSLKAATELVAGKSNPGDGEAASSAGRACESELCPELLKERWESAGYMVRAARAEAALHEILRLEVECRAYRQSTGNTVTWMTYAARTALAGTASAAGDERRLPDPASPLEGHETGPDKQTGDDTVVSESGNDRYQVCPRCEGQKYDKDNCGLCQNTGILDDEGVAYFPPPGYDKGAPTEIVARLNSMSKPRYRYG